MQEIIVARGMVPATVPTCCEWSSSNFGEEVFVGPKVNACRSQCHGLRLEAGELEIAEMIHRENTIRRLRGGGPGAARPGERPREHVGGRAGDADAQRVGGGDVVAGKYHCTPTCKIFLMTSEMKHSKRMSFTVRMR